MSMGKSVGGRRMGGDAKPTVLRLRHLRFVCAHGVEDAFGFSTLTFMALEPPWIMKENLGGRWRNESEITRGGLTPTLTWSVELIRTPDCLLESAF